MKSEDFLLRTHTKGHRRLCRRVPPRERSSRHKIRSMPRKPHPQDSRLSAVSPSRATAFTPTHKILDGDFSTQITYHATERIKWSAFSATKMAQLCRVIFSKQ